MSTAIKTLYRPFNAVGAHIYKVAARRQARLEGPLADHILQADKLGEDLCDAVNREFARNAWALWPYRMRRLSEEICALRSGGAVSLAAFNLKDLVVITRVATRLMAAFMFGVMFFRGSIPPLLSPQSPLLQGFEFVNPNHDRI